MRSLIHLTISLLCILSPSFGQWDKTIIDDDMNFAVSVDVADLVGDANLDLLVTNALGAQIILYQNNYPVWNKFIIDDVTATFAYCGDINGDDTLDIVASIYFAGQIVWYENNHPIWTPHTIDANTDHGDFMLVADFNNDDRPDVVTAGDYVDGGDVVWYENNYPDWPKHIIESGSDKYPSLNVSDVDGDGFLDVVATMEEANKVVWFKNANNGLSWTKYTIDDSLIGAFGISSGDLDGDDTLDIVATSRTANVVTWYEKHDSTWTKNIIDANYFGSFWPGITDVDGDDTMDVIVTSAYGSQIVWYENNHPIWTPHTIDPSIAEPRLFVFSDVDGDDSNDLIVAAEECVAMYTSPYTTAIELVSGIVPTRYLLLQNYPNPFNPITTIAYALPASSDVTLTIYNITGRTIKTFRQLHQPVGTYNIQWSGADDSGNPVSTGVYLCRLEAGDYSKTIKMVYLK